MTDTTTHPMDTNTDPDPLRALVREGLHEAGWYARANLDPRDVDGIAAMVLDLVAEQQSLAPAYPVASSASAGAVVQVGPEEVPVLVVPTEALDREEMAQVVHEGGWGWCANGREEWRWCKALPREQKVAYAKADAVLRHLRGAATALNHATDHAADAPAGTDRSGG